MGQFRWPASEVADQQKSGLKHTKRLLGRRPEEFSDMCDGQFLGLTLWEVAINPFS